MKKRIFALALALCMMLSVMPTSFAGNGFLSDDSKAAPQSGILTDDSKAVSQSGVLTGASKYYRQDGILYNTGSQSGASYSLPSGTLTSGNATTFDLSGGNSGGQTSRAAIPGYDTLDEGETTVTTDEIHTTWPESGENTPGQSGDTETPVDNAGIVTTKDLMTDDDGKPYLRLESYVTGSTTTSTRTTPLDIVLVLDQSGSMGDDFGGNSTNDNEARRQYAMKKAVINFIEAVNEKYNAVDSDHRMAIVTFSDSAAKLQDLGWTYVNESGKTKLTEAVNGLPDTPDEWGGTRTDLGMSMAQTLITNKDYSGKNTTRQTVVILFTDGAPGSLGGFEISIADAVIQTSKALKDDGCLVYTIGIFDGAEPTQLYGSDSSLFSPYSDGSVNSIWRNKTWRLSLSKLFGGVLPEDVPACNRFLNYVSSNYSEADKIGLTTSHEASFLGGYYGYKITQNFSRTSSNHSEYYKKATDADSLNDIFETITDTITSGSASVQLGTDTVVKDVISDYFRLPVGTTKNDIKVYTARYVPNGNWGEDEPSSLTADISNVKTVTVSGFDFSANYCETNKTDPVGRQDGDNDKSGNFYGRKLIIEIPIEQEPNFLGGQNVPTNAPGSGIYKGDNTLMEIFESPTVNIFIPEIHVTAKNKNVYLSDELETEDMLREADVSIGSQQLKLDEENFGLKPWQYAFLQEIKLTTDPATWNGTEDGTFTVTCTVTPNHGDAKEGTSAAANIYVFKPEITFNDTTIYLGTAADYSKNHTDNPVVWKHGAASSTDEGVTMTGTRPSVTVEYNPIADYFTECKDVSVSTVKLNGNGNYVTDTTFWNNGTKTDNRAPQFTVHVIRPTITFDDIEIYLSRTPRYNPRFGWDTTCQGNHSDIPGITGTAPTVGYVYSPDEAAFTECTEVNVTVKLGDVDYTNAVTLKNGDGTVRGAERAEFKVHVFLPQIVLESQDLWADYDCDVALNKGIKSITITKWADQCGIKEEKQHTDALPQCSGPHYQFTRNDKEITGYNAKNVQVTDYSTINVALGSVTIGATEYAVSVLPTVTPVEYKIHVNKFDLTINKTWNGADVYKQDAIFTVSGGRGTFQVVLPAGQDSIVIKGLLCGQDYTVTEDSNWTWRWNSSSEKPVLEKTDTAHTSVSVRNPHDQTPDGTNPGAHGAKSVSFTNTLKETLGELWFSFCTFVKNIFGAGRFEGRGN